MTRRAVVSAKPSVLFITSYSPKAVGGVGQFMIDLGRRLAAQGVRVGMCYRREDEEYELPDSIASLTRFEILAGSTKRFRTPMLLLRTLAKMLAARGDFEVYHLIVPQPMTAVAALVAKITGIPTVVTVFAPYPRTRLHPAGLLQNASEKLVLKLAGAIAYECEATAREFPDYRGSVVLNGIDTDFYRPNPSRRSELRAALGIRPEKIIVMYIGRIAESKGIKDLLAAFAELPDACRKKSRLMLVGPLEMSREALAPATSASDIIFVGPVEKDAVRDYYVAADIFVLPSYREGISSSLIEAMSCAIPPLVTDVGGNPEVVRDGEEGYVFKSHNEAELAQRLATLIADGDLRHALGARARERIELRFNLSTMAREYMRIYARLDQHGSPRPKSS